MRLFLLASLLSGVVHVQASSPVRYRDSMFVVDKTSDVVYGSSPTFRGASRACKLDLYEPAGDRARERPLVVLMHGGGFMSGDKKERTLVDLCTYFAKRGFVCASINYRTGISSTHTYAEFGRTICRAVEDAKAAVRFFVSGNSRIDKTRLYVGGCSAGGVIACIYAYESVPEGYAGIDTIGCGNPSSPCATPRPTAIVNMWGGVPDARWIKKGDPAILSIHGTRDKVVPYGKGCGMKIPWLTMYGSSAIDSVARSKGIASVLYSEPVGHGKFSTHYIVPKMYSFLYDNISSAPAAKIQTGASAFPQTDGTVVSLTGSE